MADKKTKNRDPWLTYSGVKKEAKRVRWPKWKTEGNTAGIAQNTGEVLLFTGFFGLFFVICDFVVTYLLKFIGIGA